MNGTGYFRNSQLSTHVEEMVNIGFQRTTDPIQKVNIGCGKGGLSRKYVDEITIKSILHRFNTIDIGPYPNQEMNKGRRVEPTKSRMSKAKTQYSK